MPRAKKHSTDPSEAPAMARMNTGERRMMRSLASETGLDPNILAGEMAAAYLRLVVDAPGCLPSTPLMGLVKRARAARNG